LAQLGLFAVVGLMTAVGVTRWVLPVVVPAGFAAREVPISLVRRTDRLRKGRWLVPASVVLATSALMWSDTALWETDLASLTSIPDAQKQVDQRLRGELRVPDVRDLLAIEGPTQENVLQRAEAIMPRLDGLRAGALLSSYDSAARYLPSRHSQQQRQEALPVPQDLERDLAEAVTGLPFAQHLFAPFLAAIEQARQQPLLERAAFQGTAFAMKIDSLLVEQHDRWMAIIPLRGVADRTQLSLTVRGWHDPAIVYVDLKEESNRLMTAYRDRTLVLLGWGTAVIVVALAIGLHSVGRLCRVLAPIASALLVVVAGLNLSGASLSLFHVATFLLVIGLGLDYAVFFTRPEGTEAERARTVFGLLVCATTTILVFGVLACSRIPVLHAIGITAASGSLCCLFFAGLMAKPRREGDAQ
jgi:predicted exporter